MTRRNRAENVPEEELQKLVFVPFANPFRVYELWRDVQAFAKVFDQVATGYCFNSGGFWKSSDVDLRGIPLATSLRLQTALLLNELSWEDLDILPGAQIPTKQSVDAILPGYYESYHPQNVENRAAYLSTVRSRFRQRIRIRQRKRRSRRLRIQRRHQDLHRRRSHHDVSVRPQRVDEFRRQCRGAV